MILALVLLIAGLTISLSPDPFVSTWKVNGIGYFSKDISLTFWPGKEERIISIDWGDGESEDVTISWQYTSYPVSHTYDKHGEYAIKVYGQFNRASLSETKMLSVDQWGENKWGSFEHALTRSLWGEDSDWVRLRASDSPDLSGVTEARYMAYSYAGQILDLHNWDVSNIENMESMFNFSKLKSAGISGWDVSSATDMSRMFSRADQFNENISQWDTSSVKKMTGMFAHAKSFNSDISQWDTSSVVEMEMMFYDALSFKGDISTWDVSSVNSMHRMFEGVSLPSEIYDSMLIKWSKQHLQKNVRFHAGNSQYSSKAATAREHLISHFKWEITDGGTLGADN